MDWKEIWQRAKTEDIGLEIPTEDYRRVSNALYEARKELNDPELDDFMLANVPEGILIVRKQLDVFDGTVG